MTDRTVEGIREVLAGKTRWRSPLLFAGPAVIASIAYMDPGNFATNIRAGAKYGYALLWVVLMANIDRDAVPGAVGQARHRHRAQSGRIVPRAFSETGGLGSLDRQRGRGDGDRPRRIPRRRDRPFAPAAYPAHRRHGRHGRPHLRHPDVRGPRVSPDRAHHRLARRGDRALLSRRDVHRADRLGARRGSAALFRSFPTPAR